MIFFFFKFWVISGSHSRNIHSFNTCCRDRRRCYRSVNSFQVPALETQCSARSPAAVAPLWKARRGAWMLNIHTPQRWPPRPTHTQRHRWCLWAQCSEEKLVRKCAPLASVLHLHHTHPVSLRIDTISFYIWLWIGCSAHAYTSQQKDWECVRW